MTGTGVPVKVVVAMSGGVDSSVAAALLLQQNFEVIGVTLDVWPPGARVSDVEKSCCSLAAAEDARRVCHKLDIPHYMLNFRRLFEERIIEDFCREYLAGRTPNPCIRCNDVIKFELLLDRALALGAEHLATGHYARIASGPNGSLVLKKAIDETKDQSYVLYGIGPHKMRELLFPLGEMTKDEVRAVARKLGLRVADKAESQEICFVAGQTYADFVKERTGGSGPGSIVDLAGEIVGEHDGIEGYTVGQRKGLGPRLSGPKYVVRIDAASQAVAVGDESDLYARDLVATETMWCSGVSPTDEVALSAKVRYNSEETSCRVRALTGGKVVVRFDKPQRAVTPGQAVVFYDGEIVMGGATIDRTGDDLWDRCKPGRDGSRRE